MSSLTHAGLRLGTGTRNVAISPLTTRRSRRGLADEIAALTGTTADLWLPVDADGETLDESAEARARRLVHAADVLLAADKTTAATAAGAARTLLGDQRNRDHALPGTTGAEQEARNARRRAASDQAQPADGLTREELAAAARYARTNGVYLDAPALKRLAYKLRDRRIAAEIAAEQAAEQKEQELAAKRRKRRADLAAARTLLKMGAAA
ncbi:hypothetical protein ABZW10_32930 [Kitasatospora sp. NPDC004723]|uniref:hypothetical protein n=1 Tax=Kitasatospora sp. NPDC004723 TaxID=3154288 RepID=UPI0033B90DAF